MKVITETEIESKNINVNPNLTTNRDTDVATNSENTANLNKNVNEVSDDNLFPYSFSYIKLKDYHVYSLDDYLYCFHVDNLSKFINENIIQLDVDSNIQDKIVFRNICYNIGLILSLLSRYNIPFTNKDTSIVSHWMTSFYKYYTDDNEQVSEVVLFLTNYSNLINLNIQDTIELGLEEEEKGQEEKDEDNLIKYDCIYYYKVRAEDLLKLIAICGLFNNII